MPGRVVVQWDKDDCEDMKMIKVDLLGLGMMAVLQDAVELTHQRGHGVDLAHISKDDPGTFALMQKADTIGTFQVESRAQMATLPRMKPKVFYDVAIEVAIIRPGPIVGELVHPYLARRNGEQPVTYFHPDIEPILERTLGVVLFQEQLLRVAMVMADFDATEADELRRAISSFKRSSERLQKVVAKMRVNMTRKGIANEIQDQIVKSLNSFSLYGFPESHAISFALLAYSSCWLKVHRPSEFYCALLNNQPMGFYAPSTLIKDGQRRGIRFRPVCIVNSQLRCVIEGDGSIRLGFNYVEGLRTISAQKLVETRNLKPFADIHDLLLRVPLNKAERRVLAKIGAFRLLSSHRRAALWEVEALVDPSDLFVSASRESAPSPLEPMTPIERLQADFDGTRTTTGPHPMNLLRSSHQKRASHLKDCKTASTVTVAGLVICRQRPGTAKGHVFLSLEDETGISNVFVRSELFETNRLVITHEPFLEIEGLLQNINEVISVLARKIRPIPGASVIANQSHDFH